MIELASQASMNWPDAIAFSVVVLSALGAWVAYLKWGPKG